ncbi:MAG: YjbQ family protein [Acidimicrobiaceae bacterium]|nr:YjbQ family protein [Acidimicrobiaceae bacterium]
METVEIDVATGTELVTDLTDHLLRFCSDLGDGLVNVFVPHATAGVALMETGSGSETDLAHTIDRLLPRDAAYRHRHGSPGHGRDHVMPCFVGSSATLPVVAGHPLFGTWQRLVLVDSNVDNRQRQVRFTFLSG